MQMALFSAIDATERATGVSSVMVQGAIEFENRKEPVQLQNIYAADGGIGRCRPRSRRPFLSRT